MPQLPEIQWKSKYTSDDGKLVDLFYLPALGCATGYDRTTGYFTATALALAARGIEALVRAGGRMRLIVGCTLGADEAVAIAEGQTVRDSVAAKLRSEPLSPLNDFEKDALTGLAWMVAAGHLEVKVAVPCDEKGTPVPNEALFHEKTGIIFDSEGNRLAFNGSVNETAAAWSRNWESFHVFTSWTATLPHVEDEERSFAELWAGKTKRAIVLDIPTAVRDDLLRFEPASNPFEIKHSEQTLESSDSFGDQAVNRAASKGAIRDTSINIDERRRLVWSYIFRAPTLPEGGARVGEATSAVEPWPHQVRAYHRMYDNWPPKLLIADEVGLGKTIEAGLLLRQAWLSGKAKRILVLTPKSVMRQWQIELREKFNLLFPIYDDGAFHWPDTHGSGAAREIQVGREEWHQSDCVIASSHLMRRTDRLEELLSADPWDLVILDEAHHARRRSPGSPDDKGPNQLLRLMRSLRDRTKGLVLLTATPMQVHPVEVFDLLSLLRMPVEWTPANFVSFFEKTTSGNPSVEDFEDLARLFRATEREFGQISPELVKKKTNSTIRAKKILSALRETAAQSRKMLESDLRKIAVKVIQETSPVSRLVSRNTRDLLRRYRQEGLLDARIAERDVFDLEVELSEAERLIYEEIEDYISETYNAASAKTRTSVGFVMTIYRRRLASSFQALAQTLQDRLEKVTLAAWANSLEDELFDQEEGADDLDPVNLADTTALLETESETLKRLLAEIRSLGTDTKALRLHSSILHLKEQGYSQVIVFTQYTDTLDYLRTYLRGEGHNVMCFSGRGGEVSSDGGWRKISREETKKRFKQRAADILLCTDAAAEGLNFQFCGALVNYDMPWNPMRVEQRIGRIDRLGQEFDRVRILNLLYVGTVETDVFKALRSRINLFQTVIGNLQPILSRIQERITETVLTGGRNRQEVTGALIDRIETEIRTVEQGGGFDLDAVVGTDFEPDSRPPAALDLAMLRQVLRRPELLPPGWELKPISDLEFALTVPGRTPVRVTTDRGFFDDHPESSELWSTGSDLFPQPGFLGLLEPDESTPSGPSEFLELISKPLHSNN